MKDKKFLIIIGVLLLVFLGLLFWPKNGKKNTSTTVNDNKLTEPSPDFVMDSPKKISWVNPELKNYVKSEILLTEQKIIEINRKMETRNTILKETNSNEAVFKFDDNRNSFEFNSNITEKKQIGRGNLTSSNIGTRFLALMEKLNEVTGAEVQIEEFGNKQFLSPWWVSSDGKNVDAIEVLANYYYKDMPVKTFSGYMVKADFLTNGILAKMENKLMFGKVIKTATKDLWSLSELKNKSPDNYKIWRIDGGADFELNGDRVEVGEVKITDYKLEYIYDLKSGVVWPYYFLHGNSNLNTGMAKITLIISAVKE